MAECFLQADARIIAPPQAPRQNSTTQVLELGPSPVRYMCRAISTRQPCSAVAKCWWWVAAMLPLATLSRRPPSFMIPTRAPGRRLGRLVVARDFQTATLLSDGRVLVAGGFGTTGKIAKAEVYNPSTATWSS